MGAYGGKRRRDGCIWMHTDADRCAWMYTRCQILSTRYKVHTVHTAHSVHTIRSVHTVHALESQVYSGCMVVDFMTNTADSYRHIAALNICSDWTVFSNKNTIRAQTYLTQLKSLPCSRHFAYSCVNGNSCLAFILHMYHIGVILSLSLSLSLSLYIYTRFAYLGWIRSNRFVATDRNGDCDVVDALTVWHFRGNVCWILTFR